MARPRKKTGLNFEESLKQLETIVERLEDEHISLEDSLKLFAEGKGLAKACEEQLRVAENRVRELMAQDGDEDTGEPNTPEETDSEDEADPAPRRSGQTKDDLPF